MAEQHGNARDDSWGAPPDWLSVEARDVYERTAQELTQRRAPVDRDTLAVYASAVVQHARATQLVDQSSVLVRGQGNRLTRNPAAAVARDAAATVARLAHQLGLTRTAPAAPTPRRRASRRNVRAAEDTIAALRATGRLEAADESTIALVRTLATALDTLDPEARPAQMASIARCQLSAIKLLRGVADEPANAGYDELLAALGDLSEP
jgi:P27 family predicted phage terminase small subunit